MDATAIALEAKAELEGHLIPFWLSMQDKERGGFYGFMNFFLKVEKDAAKGCILNSRILYFFSEAYRILGDERCREGAKAAFEFLQNNFLDERYGGVFWSVDAEGKKLDTTKHTYAQAFAVYALSTYYKATGEKEAIFLADKLFNLIEEKSWDGRSYRESFTEDFVPQENDKLSENGVSATYTMNTLLHVFEAYTAFVAATGNEKAKRAMERILDIFARDIWNEKKKRQEVFFDSDMKSLIDLYSYGHDIETSWLLDKGLGVLSSPEYEKKILPLTSAMAENVLAAAFSDGAVATEDERGSVDGRRVWWVQCESIVGFVNAWQKTSDEGYLKAAYDAWDFTKEHIIDKRSGGEWLWRTYKNGAADKTLPEVSPWKCPYHNGRMCFELIERTGTARSKEN